MCRKPGFAVEISTIDLSIILLQIRVLPVDPDPLRHTLGRREGADRRSSIRLDVVYSRQHFSALLS